MDLHAVGEGERLELPEDQHTLSLGFYWETKDGEPHEGMDADASCLLFNAKGVCTGAVNFARTVSPDGAFRHEGDRIADAMASTGKHDGRDAADEAIAVELDRVDARVFAVALLVSCFSGALADLARVEVRVRARAFARGAWTTRELASYSLDGARSAAFRANCAAGHTAMMVGALWRCAAHGAAAQRWVFGAGGPGASGVGSTTEALLPIAQRGLKADAIPALTVAGEEFPISRVQDIARHIHPPTIRRLQRRFEEQDGGGFMEYGAAPSPARADSRLSLIHI